MKKITIQQKWAYDDLQKVVVKNYMATLMVDASVDSSVSVEGMVTIDEPYEEFELGSSIGKEYQDGVLTITLEELESFGYFSAKASQIRLSIPENVSLEVETMNFPISVVGLNSSIKLESENAPVSINNCDGDKHIESENGPVRIHNSNGNLYAKLENGPISAEAISGEGLHLISENGPIKLRLACFNKVEIETENGPIYYETQPVEGGDFKFKTENGIVHLVLPLNFSFSIKAESESGRLKSKLDFPVEKADGVFKIENIYDDEAPTMIQIVTENGMIKLSSDSYINLDYIKAKLDQIKQALDNANTSEEKEKVKDLLAKVVTYLNKAAASISEEKIKAKVTVAITKLKDMTENIDLDETRKMIIVNVEDIGTQIYDGIKEGIKDVKESFDGLKYEHLNTDSLQEYIHKVMESPLIKPYLKGEQKQKEKDLVAERSRLKILEMLESGKITSEEAERLLKAIGKE